MTAGKKQILARVIGIQRENVGNRAVFRKEYMAFPFQNALFPPPLLSFWILISLAKICFFQAVINRAKIPLFS